jgi:hypothetical protein
MFDLARRRATARAMLTTTMRQEGTTYDDIVTYSALTELRLIAHTWKRNNGTIASRFQRHILAFIYETQLIILSLQTLNLAACESVISAGSVGRRSAE